MDTLRGFTVGGAQCLGFGREDNPGSIEAGELADFIVLDRNIFEQSVETLYQTQVDAAVVGGDIVYEQQ